WSSACTSLSANACTSSWPTWPPAPVIRTFMASTGRGAQRLPPPAVRPIPLDRVPERLVEGTHALPAELGDLVDIDGVAAVVAEPVLHVLDHLLAGPEARQQLVDQHAV